MDEKPHVVIYTDGGASPNPGPGGWGAILVSQARGTRREIRGGEAQTTNNRMELTAAIEALKRLKMPCRVDLYTDSQYLRNAFEQDWLGKWQRNGWKTAGKKPVLNQDLWQELIELTKKHDVTWHWVKGHAGHPENERADELVGLARKELRTRGHRQP